MRLHQWLCALLLVTGCASNSEKAATKPRVLPSHFYKDNREKYVNEHPEIPKHLADAIREGYTVRGLTEDQFRIVMGDPNSVNRTTTQHGETVQWVYGMGHYYYFRDGKLDSWQRPF
jgi:hypothetical protein